jgi:hypothetical protein
VPDNDYAGLAGMGRWAEQLDGITAIQAIYDYSKLLRDDGQPVKDLRDFLKIDDDQWREILKEQSPLATFILYLKQLNEK